MMKKLDISAQFVVEFDDEKMTLQEAIESVDVTYINDNKIEIRDVDFYHIEDEGGNLVDVYNVD